MRFHSLLRWSIGGRDRRSPAPVEVPARAAYDEWAATYPAEAHNPLMHAEEEAVIARLQGCRMTRVLDAGAGTGRYSTILRSVGAESVISLDWSHEMLMHQAGSVPRVCGDATRLPFSDRVFDFVNASLMAGDIADLASWLTEIARVLTPDGRVIYSDFHPAWNERGWLRTFQDRRGRTVAVQCHTHSYEAHRAALSAAGLREEALDEISVVPQASGLNRWRRVARAGLPALVVVSARKTRESSA